MPIRYLVADTETTGVFVFDMVNENGKKKKVKRPSQDPAQPHIVEISAALVDEDWNVLMSSTQLVKPDGWTISDEAIAIHGITNEMAEADGVPELEALTNFLDMARESERVIFHNSVFDQRIIRIAIKRLIDKDPPATAFDEREADGPTANWWRREVKHCCTMRSGAKLIQGKGAFVKLADIYAHLFPGEQAQDQHTAKGDVQSTLRIAAELHRRGALYVLGGGEK